jgi:hypothetical protein
VKSLTTKFGENAGKLWSVLNGKGCLNKDEIMQITNFNENDFNSAVGWLARENKIFRENGDCFKIDNTNLVSEIGPNAGRVWKIIEIWGKVDFASIKRLSDLNDNEIYLALGWLAREDKIFVDEKSRFKLK